MDKDTLSYEDAFGPTSAPAVPSTGQVSYEDAFGLPPAQAKRRTLAAIANDTVIEGINATVGGVSAAANFIKPGNAFSGYIDRNIQAGEASQSDLVKAEKARLRQEIADADGAMGELGAVGRYVVDNPLLSAAQAVGSFVGPGAAVKGGRTLASIAGLNAARGGLAGGVAAGAAMAGGDAAGTAYELSTKGGATDEQAVAAGRQASAIPAVIGGLGGLVGAERLVAGAKGFTGNAVSRALKTAAVEGAQEGIEEGVTQYEGQRAAMPYDKTIDPMKGVAAAAGMGAALGAATGGGVSLLTGGHGADGAPSQQQEAAPAIAQQAQAAIENVATPAIDPNAGPLSKAASMAGNLGLAPIPAQPTAQEQRATLEASAARLPYEQQREARMLMAELDNQALPPGVRAMRDARLQELVGEAPAAPVELAPQDMERGRVVQNFDARNGLPPLSDYAPMIEEAITPEYRAEYQRLLKTAQDQARPVAERDAAAEVLHATFSPDQLQRARTARPTPDTRLELQDANPARYDNAIDFTASAGPSTTANPDAARIAELALAADLQPGEPMALNRAHALRRAAAEAGIPVSVIPHPSGRGYDVAPTARLDPAAQKAMPQQEAAALLPFDQSPSGRMLASQSGAVRAETRPEAVARGNAATAQRQQVEADRQRRMELGLSNITPVVPVADMGNSTSPRVTFDNSPTGGVVVDASGVRQQRRAEVVNRTNQPAPAPQTVTSASGAPFASRQAAQQELQRQQLASTHEVAPAGGDESLGFVLREKGANQVAVLANKAQAAINSVANRGPNWRTNAMQANRIARQLGIETKGKRLAQVVAEIDAADSATSASASETNPAPVSVPAPSSMRSEGVGTPTMTLAQNAPELVAADAVESSAGSTSGAAQWGGQQQTRPAVSGPQQESDANADAGIDGKASEAINSGANSPAAGPRPARAAAPRPTAKIEDFGETLHGARKMLYTEAYADGMAKAKELDTKAHPLSKTWPEPDYQKLLEGGAPVPAVSLVRALRDAVPTKPQSSWKLKGWSAQVETLRSFAEDALAGSKELAAVRSELNRNGMPQGIADKAALYEAMGHELSLKGIKLSAGHYSMYDRVTYNPPRTIWSVSREAKGSTFGNWPRELAKGDTREEAIAAFKQRATELLAEEQAPTNGATFEIYSKRAGGAREFYVGKKIGRNVAELKTGFADLKAARQYLADNQAELENLLAQYKAVPPVRNTQNAPRIGEDYRKGADVTPEQFQEAFGFRGVQFGNYVEGGRRQQDLNRAYDALMDLAGVLALPPRALSLGGRLGLAFGARGSGGTDAAAAHYERGNVVINLTKREGAGSLAHEWWHGLDNYFSRERGVGDAYMTVDSQSGSGVREEMRAAFREVNSAINRTRMQERSRKLDDRRTKEYWTTKPEMSARAFESYVIAKLQDQNAGNDYLANVVGASVFALEGGYPYPTAGELPVIRGAFDAFFQAVETRQGDGGAVVLYNTSDSAPPGRGLSVEQTQQAVQKALAGLRNPPPIDIVGRSEEAWVGAPEGVMGAAIPEEGRIVLVASAHGSADAVVETLFHEMFHLGVHKVLPTPDYVQSMLDLAKRDTSSLSADEKAAFDEAARSGVIDVTMAHDLAGIAQGEDQNVSWRLRPAMRAASFLFHHAEKFNRQVTFVAAYRLAREAGADATAAYEQAAQATYDGHFDYSANNRPRVMQGNVARVLLLFKQYGQNMVYTLARSAQQSLKGATPEARAEARKALGGLLTMHAMAAGALGLPMVTTLLAAASMLGGDDDEPWDAKVALQNVLADALGQKPAEVLAHGLSRLTPFDISGRVGLDKLIFPDVQEGLEGQRLAESAMTAALGPVAGIGVNVLKGMQEMSEGRYARGLETMAPAVLRGPVKAIRYGDEGVKDKTGIVVQDEVSAAELLGQAAGFSPSSVRNSFEGKSAIVQQDRALQARRSALVEQFAMAAMAGDEGGKAEAREDIAKFNEKNPNRRIQPMQLAQSVNQRQKRIREAQEGVYLPSKRRDALEAGRFAVPD